MLNTFLRSCGVVAMIGLLGCGTANADDLGKAEYLNYCASCHGLDAQGTGPLTEFMNVKVPDLTTIAQRNDGAFPFLDVVHMVDGRSGVMAHGSEMPVWGDQFMADAGEIMARDLSAVYEARGRVLSLVSYLETIQK